VLLDVLLEQGYAYFQLGDVRRSRRGYNRALALIQRLRSQLPADVALRKRLAALRGRGNVEHNADANEACAASHRAALVLARYLRAGPETAMEQVNLADAQWGCWSYAEALDTYKDALETANRLCYADGREFGLLCRGALLWSVGQYALAADSLNAGLELARGVGSAWSIAYGLAYLSNVHASRGAMSTALSLSQEAIALAEGAGEAYPLSLAMVSAAWQQEVRAPGLLENGQAIETALRQARRLGLRGLALHLAWVRLLHRVADPSVPDDVLTKDLERLVQTTETHPPVRGATELLGLQVACALERHRPGVDSARLQQLVAGITTRKAASLGSGEWAAYRDRYVETRRPWEDQG
jgi:tetratricopeptide (TPR) repeat protein